MLRTSSGLPGLPATGIGNSGAAKLQVSKFSIIGFQASIFRIGGLRSRNSDSARRGLSVQKCLDWSGYKLSRVWGGQVFVEFSVEGLENEVFGLI